MLEGPEFGFGFLPHRFHKFSYIGPDTEVDPHDVQGGLRVQGNAVNDDVGWSSVFRGGVECAFSNVDCETPFFETLLQLTKPLLSFCTGSIPEEQVVHVGRLEDFKVGVGRDSWSPFKPVRCFFDDPLDEDTKEEWRLNRTLTNSNVGGEGGLIPWCSENARCPNHDILPDSVLLSVP